MYVGVNRVYNIAYICRNSGVRQIFTYTHPYNRLSPWTNGQKGAIWTPYSYTSSLISIRPASTVKRTEKQTTKIQGSVLKMRRMAGRPEFHCIDRDRHGHIIEPTDVFMLVLTTSKNNVHAQIVDKSKNYKTIFGSYGGNVGFHKAERKTERCAYRIGENIARKCRRLGIFCVDIKFRRVMRIDAVLQAIQSVGLKVRQLIHEPKLPKTSAHAVKPRRRRRV